MEQIPWDVIEASFGAKQCVAWGTIVGIVVRWLTVRDAGRCP